MSVTIEPADPEIEGGLTITVGGRKAWVFQRKNRAGERGGSFYVSGQVPGQKKPFRRSTGFNTESMALPTARKLWKAALEGRTEALEETKIKKAKPIATVGEIVQAHALAEENGRLNVKDGQGYRSSLRRVVAWALGLHDRPEGAKRERIDTEAVDRQSGSILTGELVADFCANYVKPAGSDFLLRDQRLRGAHSVLINARSMFEERAREAAYKTTALPDLAGFLDAKLKKAVAVEHRPLTDGAVWEMAQAALCLKDSAPGLYLVHLCMRQLGMRNDEVENARVEWVVKLTEPKKVYLPDGSTREVVAEMRIERRSYWVPKKSSGKVSISADVFAELEIFLKDKQPLDFLVPAEHVTARTDLIDRTHSDFMRPWTEDHQKTSYELRRWGATLIAKLHASDEMAGRFLRHGKKTVAALHYVTEPPPVAPITLEDCGL